MTWEIQSGNRTELEKQEQNINTYIHTLPPSQLIS